MDVSLAARARLAEVVPREAHVLVGVSGGVDSQCLLCILADARAAGEIASLTAAGVNHGLRPEAACELDMAATLAERLGVPFASKQVRVPDSGNRLAEARRARYGALRALKEDVGAHVIALAHHADDQVETMLMRLAAGTGPQGLAAMAYRRGDLVRPLLDVPRTALAAFARQRGLSWADDPSNAQGSRALVRERITPALAQLNPSYARHMQALAQRLAQESAALDALLEPTVRACRGDAGELRVAPLRALPVCLVERVLRAWLAGRGLVLNAAKVGALASLALAHSSGSVSAAGWHVQRDRDALWLHPDPRVRATGRPAQALALPGELALDPGCLVGEVCDVAQLPENWRDRPDLVAFDAKGLHVEGDMWPKPTLVLRGARRGERWRRFSGDEQKVSRLLADRKVARTRRLSWPVVALPRTGPFNGEREDDILWVVGLGRSHHAPVTRNTRRVLVLRLKDPAVWTRPAFRGTMESLGA